jgi:hypothetical protein
MFRKPLMLWKQQGNDHEAKQTFESGIPAGMDTPDHYFSPPDGRADGNDWVLVLESK